MNTIHATTSPLPDMSNDAHILVVDDEPGIRETVEEFLELHGYRVTCADGGAAMRGVLEKGDVDLVVLDIAMPGEDGLTLARYLREHKDVAIVMLTASGETVDRIIGLEVGADDYLAKPVDLRELLARIKAVLRRVRPTGEGRASPAAHVVPFGDFHLDLDARKLFDADGGEVALTSMEFALLKAFAEHPNKVLSRDQLLELAHNRPWEPFDRSIDIRVGRIRKKIERDPAKPEIIKTVHGAGYVYACK